MNRPYVLTISIIPSIEDPALIYLLVHSPAFFLIGPWPATPDPLFYGIVIRLSRLLCPNLTNEIIEV